jgi:hypothetical protein
LFSAYQHILFSSALADMDEELPSPSLQESQPAVLSPLPQQAEDSNSEDVTAKTEIYAARDEYIPEVNLRICILVR